MDSWASTPAVRRNMQAIKRRDTQIELAVRRILHARGLRFRVDYAPIDKRRRADIVFTRRRVVVFIDGCFWHGCAKHYVAPKSHSSYWADKVSRNVARDAETNERLADSGWLVLRFWVHEPSVEIADRIERAIQVERGGQSHDPKGELQ